MFREYSTTVGPRPGEARRATRAETETRFPKETWFHTTRDASRLGRARRLRLAKSVGSVKRPPRPIPTYGQWNGAESSVQVRAPDSAAIDRNIRPARLADIDLPGPGDLLLGIDDHLLPLGQPADGARNGEEHGEHVRRDAHDLVDDA